MNHTFYYISNCCGNSKSLSCADFLFVNGEGGDLNCKFSSFSLTFDGTFDYVYLLVVPQSFRSGDYSIVNV